MVDIQVRGADKLHVLARVLREASDKELQRELYRGLNRSVKPLRQDVKDAIPDFLPGRYAVELSRDLSIRTRRRSGSANPAIYLVGSAKTRDIASLNRGRLRHPLFGNRKRWYDQRIKPGFWTDTLERGAPRVRRELVIVLNDVARKIARKVG